MLGAGLTPSALPKDWLLTATPAPGNLQQAWRGCSWCASSGGGEREEPGPDLGGVLWSQVGGAEEHWAGPGECLTRSWLDLCPCKIMFEVGALGYLRM